MRRCGACILDVLGPRLTGPEKRFLAVADPFGFILFARNVATPEQVRALCDELRAAVGRAAPIFIDQEGGRVQRLRPPHWRAWPAPLDQARAAGARAAEVLRLRYRLIADELLGLGIDANCAPVADVAQAATHPFLKNRCYGTTPESVAVRARAVADGLLAGGVLPVLKHIPGHGRARLDSHQALPVAQAPAQELRMVDFAPFAALADLPMAMTAHVVYPAFDDRPATLSPVMMRLIREEIGFDGLVMSDDISMKALKGPPAEIARAVIAAGCDVVLHCNGTLEEKRQVAEAAGRLGEAAARRAARALAARRAPDAVDIAALRAKLEALTDGGGDGA